MTPHPLDWCGQIMKPGDFYGGRPENIPKTWGQNPALAAAKKHQHYAVITEEDLAEVFGSYKLTRAEAAKRLELLTFVHRTTAYRALTLKGRFARHLRAEGTMLTWR